MMEDAKARESGYDALAQILTEIDESETLKYGPQHSFARWSYVAVGLFLVFFGPDFVDGARQYVTEGGLVLTKLAYAAITFGAFRTRTVNSSYKAYRSLQKVIDKLKVVRPQLFGEESLAAAGLVGSKLEAAWLKEEARVGRKHTRCQLRLARDDSDDLDEQ